MKQLKRTPLTTLLLGLLSGLCLGLLFATPTLAAGPSSGEAPEPYHLVVLHTNDVHGQVLPRDAFWLKRDDNPTAGGLARVAAMIQRVREEAEAEGAGVLVVDGGDWFQGTPEGALDDGLGFVKALRAVGYDALAVGNHEFDLGLPNLQRLISLSRLPAVSANLFEPGVRERCDWVPPYRVFERGPIRIGVVGLITTSTPGITHHDARSIDFRSPAVALERAYGELDGEVDWVLPITHLGVDADRRLAREHPWLELIVGGHSHTFLRKGVMEGDTAIVQVGSKASALGRVDVWFDPTTREAVRVEVSTIELLDDPEPRYRNAGVERLSAALVERSEARMNQVVGRLERPLVRSRHPLQSSNVGNLIADSIRAATGAQVGIHNRGGIRCNLEAGDITLRHLFELLPFENSVVAMDLKGSDLHEILRESVESRAHSGLEVSGLTLEYRGSEGDVRLARVLIGDRELEPEETVRIATNSFLARGGDDMVILEHEGTNRLETPMILREVLEQVFRSKGSVDAPVENRYRAVD